jgi:hypothetical protein
MHLRVRLEEQTQELIECERGKVERRIDAPVRMEELGEISC